MSTVEELRRERQLAERTAVLLLGVGALALAIVCGSVIVSGWFAGALQDRYERWFWGGALLGMAMLVVFAIAAMPGGRNDRRTLGRVRGLIRVGLALLILSPLLCVGALVADFYL